MLVLGNKFNPTLHKTLVESSFVDYGSEVFVPTISNLSRSIKSFLLAKKEYRDAEKQVRLLHPEIAEAQDAARLDGGLSAYYQWVRLNELRKFIETYEVNSVCEFGSGGSTALWNALIDGTVCSLEESEKWLKKTESILPQKHSVDLIHAKRRVIEFSGEPSTCYDLDEGFFNQAFDLVYIDGPTAKPINASEEVLPILDKHNKAMPNIDVELFIRKGNPPKYILVDGRRPTVRRLCQNYADIYDIYLRYFYNYRWARSGGFLYHTILIRKQ